MDDDASTNIHAGDAAVNAHSAAPIDADALDTAKSEVTDPAVAADVAEQIEEDQPIHVPLGT